MHLPLHAHLRLKTLGTFLCAFFMLQVACSARAGGGDRHDNSSSSTSGSGKENPNAPAPSGPTLAAKIQENSPQLTDANFSSMQAGLLRDSLYGAITQLAEEMESGHPEKKNIRKKSDVANTDSNFYLGLASQKVCEDEIARVRSLATDTSAGLWQFSSAEAALDLAYQYALSLGWMTTAQKLDLKNELTIFRTFRNAAEADKKKQDSLRDSLSSERAKRNQNADNRRFLILVFVLMAIALGLVFLGFRYFNSITENTDMDPEFAKPAPGSFHPVEKATALEEEIFRVVQAAWCQEDMAAAAFVMSDSVRASFQSILNLRRRRKVKIEISNVFINSAEVRQVVESEEWESRDILFLASVTETERNFQTNEQVSQERLDFEQTWTFIRKKNARKMAAPLSLWECPNCGQAADFKKSPRCGRCGTLRNTGLSDWVLSRITRDEKSLSLGKHGIEGALLEERAMAFFWRYAEAKLDGKATDWRQRFSGLLPEAYVPDHYQDVPIGINKLSLGECNLLEMTEEPGMLIAMIRVRYSYYSETGVYQYSSIRFKLIRSKSNPRPVDFASLTCQSCGGARGFSLTCDYCGTPWPNPQGEWLLGGLQ